MNAGRFAALGLLVCCVIPGTAADSDKESREILDRAIRAHGGADALNKTHNCKRTDRGTQALLDKEETFVGQVSRSLPDKIRLQIEVGKNFRTLIVLDGENGYQSDNNGPAAKMQPARLKELREEIYLTWITTLSPLTKKEFTLTTLPPTKFEGEEAVGFKVEYRGHADTKLYFGKRSGLLIRAERRVMEGGIGVDKEYIYSAHQRISGVVVATKETHRVNKKKWTEFTAGDYSFPGKFAPATFARP